MSNLKYRILIIAGLALASVWALFPRTVVERVNRNGVFVYDTLRRVPLKRGLDLQGGMHLALEVDETKGTFANKPEAIDKALTVVRNRIDRFGVAEPLVQKAGDERIIVELPGIDDPQRAQDVVQQTAFLQFLITDETQALERVLPRLDQIARDRGFGASPAPGATTDSPNQQVGLKSLFTSADSAGKDSTAADTSNLAALTTGGTGPISKLIQPGQIPGEYMVASSDALALEQYFEQPEIKSAMPPGKTLKWSSDSLVAGGRTYKMFYITDSRPIITGDYIVKARPNQVPIEGTVVEFELNNEGGRRFKNETAKHIKDHMAIVLDDRVMGRPPIIQSAIGTRGQITMGQGRELQAAQDLATVLEAGSLKVPLKIVDVRNVGPSLGRDSIRKGMLAGAIATVLVMVIMLGYYRFSGFLAVSALLLYVLYTMAMLAGFNAVLTLPGIAGLVLSVGIAVDANVLIFERIREELVRGKTVKTSIEEGFEHALSAIVDSSTTTILTAAVLYQFGTGPVRGFAVTLIAGIVASLFTALFVVRTFYIIWLRRARTAQTLSI
jgi:preprotein translocase subunit SecD